MKSLDFISSLDTIKKHALIQNFVSAQTPRRDKKQNMLAGRARLLRDAGNTEGLYHLLVTGDYDDEDDAEDSVE